MKPLVLLLASTLCLAAPPADRKPPMTLHDLSATRLDGASESLAAYKGKVVLVVNVASECGYTPQYEGLQKLYAEYKERGLVVLGFPCNQFGGQEPGGSAQIAAFCSTKFHVTFPMFEKVDVKGEKQSPVYAFLTKRLGVPDEMLAAVRAIAPVAGNPKNVTLARFATPCAISSWSERWR